MKYFNSKQVYISSLLMQVIGCFYEFFSKCIIIQVFDDPNIHLIKAILLNPSFWRFIICFFGGFNNPLQVITTFFSNKFTTTDSVSVYKTTINIEVEINNTSNIHCFYMFFSNIIYKFLHQTFTMIYHRSIRKNIFMSNLVRFVSIYTF